MAEPQAHILLVEDDVSLAQWVSDYLSAKQFRVTVSHRGDQALTAIQRLEPDLIILDWMLPGLDGLEICKIVRNRQATPIIMLTARDEEVDEVLGLEIGANDYLTKPVRPQILLARIRALLRKQNARPASDVSRMQFNDLTIDLPARAVTLVGRPIKLSSNEFDMLWILARRAGEIISRETLVNELRGFDYDGFDRSIDLRISRLRKKLGDDATNPFRIKTIWGKGYLFAKEAW